CVDVFNPKVVRASMGAIFSLNIVEFDSVEEYLKSNNNKKYFFMLNGKLELGKFQNDHKKFDLVFGNEASGLPEFLIDVDESVVIRHSKNIDSLNLPISVAMAIYEFSK
ncbi:MAG: TrmH family RNA methyltransferase, partial [Clostridia bacterium]|nr:TrmH family RNA methyltransferase [Clostridia bacterium]